MSISVLPHEDEKLIELVRDIALEGYTPPGKPEFQSREKFRWLREQGSNLWLDTGDAAAAEKVWSVELSALTTNNTLINQVVQTGEMDGLISYASRKIRELRPDMSDKDLIYEIGFLVNAKIALGLVQKFDAHVSVELHPDMGFDVGRTLVFARRYFDINPDFFYVKVPLTPDGLISVRELSRDGIPVNLTLGFSARQNYLVTRFSRPRFVNVFLGRLSSLVEENKLGSPENVGEKAALASYEAVQGLREADRALLTEQIAASIRNGPQVAKLVGIHVLTMPPKAAQEYLDMDMKQDDVRKRTSQDLHVDLSGADSLLQKRLMDLWNIDEQFIGFVEDAAKQGDQMVKGQDLVDLSYKHDVQLFHEWTEEDRNSIREKGKIPDISKWPGVPVDDLMSISALESFAKDQMELDKRIQELIHKA